jgi:hypothetical protein
MQCLNVSEEEENGDVVISYVFSQASYFADSSKRLCIVVEFVSGRKFQTLSFDVVYQIVLVGFIMFVTHPNENRISLYGFFNCVVHILTDSMKHMRHLYQQCLDVNALLYEQLQKHLLSYPEYNAAI